MNAPSPRRSRAAAQPSWQWTARARAMLRDRTAHPKADQEHVTKVTRLPSRDTTANPANPATAADRKAHPAAKLPDLDPPFLDPPDLAPPDSEWPEPEWPDPAWPGFAPGRRSPSYAFTLAASPWFKERHPDKAANLWDALHASEERHHDPEPDLEAEP